MEKLNKKQKIILIIIGIILITIIGIIGFITSSQETGTDIDLSRLLSEEDIKDLENNENSNNKQNNQNNINNEKNTINSNDIQNENLTENDNQENKIIVHITGEVKKTGILTLNQGARISDAIKAAGGATSEADLDQVNLAYKLQDGQKIYIPNKKDKNEAKVYITSESGNNVIEEGNTSEEGGKNKKVNINQATKSELETLPGIGEAMANRIIEYREQNGKFQKIDDLKNVKGIGEAKFNKIKELITI